MAELGAFLGIPYFRVQFNALVPDRIHEVLEVSGFASWSRFLFDFLPVAIENLVIVPPIGDQRALLPIKLAKGKILVPPGITTAPAPRGHTVAKMKCGFPGVRGFLIVVMIITATIVSDPLGQVHPEAPAGKVERMNPVVRHFPTAPVPAPMPVVMDHDHKLLQQP